MKKILNKLNHNYSPYKNPGNPIAMVMHKSDDRKTKQNIQNQFFIPNSNLNYNP